MIIVDTSIWIEFFKANEPYFTQLKDLLDTSRVLAVECIFAELLQGARTERERSIIKDYWINLPKHDETDLLIEAGILSSENKWISKGIGLIDSVILFIARKTSSRIWTLDRKLNSILDDSEKHKA
jgi:predicted nucleic acid-binding protein